ncbi:MAG: tail-specific protease [Chlamydiota bacterium]|jgi:carboxyl-terminal processing protease
MRKALCILLLFSSSLLLGGAPPPLKKGDVKSTLDEMFNYHVEYHEFSPLIATRSMKVYLEQFDSAKLYLTSDEVRQHLDQPAANIISHYYQENFSDFEALNSTIASAIERSRSYRQEIEADLITHADNPTLSYIEPYSSYASSEAEIKKRMKTQLTQLLAFEKQNRPPLKGWTPEERKKIFEFWERKFARHENTYLSAPAHYTYLHILKAVSKSLDAHTTYFSPEEAYEMRTSLEKQFEGIGVVLKEGVDGVFIHNMVKGGPAERSQQIQTGDKIVSIDGTSVEGVSYEEVLKRLQGKGQVRLTLLHPKEDTPYNISLKREKIVMQEERVNYAIEPYEGGVIAKITLPSFYEGGGGTLSCEQDLKEALRSIRKQGEIKGVVLDMRDNSGGFLTQAVKVAGIFMSSGVVVISKYAHGMTQYLRELDGKSYYAGPLVVLTSRASASAAEIVAQALQDYGIGIIVGDDRTYGKGTIQYQTVTDPRATNFYKVTIGRYYTVSGKTTQIEGVKADIITPTLYSSLPIGERYLEYSLKSDRIPSAYTDNLADVDPRHRDWFQKNYIPALQKKLSLWTQLLPELKEHSSERIRQNSAYLQFIKTISQIKDPSQLFSQYPRSLEQDFSMEEATSIVKEMHSLKTASVH